MSTNVKFATTITIGVDVEAEIHRADSSTGQSRYAEITGITYEGTPINLPDREIEPLAEEALDA